MKTPTQDDKLDGCVFGGALLLAQPLFAVWEGYAISVLWGWFVVPVFHAPPLHLAQAIGLDLVVSVFRWTVPSKADYDEPLSSSAPRTLSFRLLTPGIALLFGAVVRCFL